MCGYLKLKCKHSKHQIKRFLTSKNERAKIRSTLNYENSRIILIMNKLYLKKKLSCINLNDNRYVNCMVVISSDVMHIVKMSLGIACHRLSCVMTVSLAGTPCILSSSMVGFAESPAM